MLNELRTRDTSLLYVREKPLACPVVVPDDRAPLERDSPVRSKPAWGTTIPSATPLKNSALLVLPISVIVSRPENLVYWLEGDFCGVGCLRCVVGEIALNYSAANARSRVTRTELNRSRVSVTLRVLRIG